MRVVPEEPRYRIERLHGGIRAAIPARRNGLYVALLSCWLCGWAFGWVTVCLLLWQRPPSSSGGPLFVAVWLCVWTVAGMWAFSTLLWQLFGLETVTVSGGMLSHRIAVWDMGREKEFDTAQVSRLRQVGYSPGSVWWGWDKTVPVPWGQGNGPVAFDYGARTYRFGLSLDEAEGRMLVAEMAPWLENGGGSK